MDSVLLVLAINAAIKLGKAGGDAFGQYARDRNVVLPRLKTLQVPLEAQIRGLFGLDQSLITEDLLPYWLSLTSQGPKLAGDLDVLTAAYIRYQDQQQGHDGDNVVGYWMIEQWGKDGPISPFARMVLALADVALEFVARDPSLFGINGRAEPLIAAFAANMAAIIPDDPAKLGPKNQLGEALATALLRSSLKVLADYPTAVIQGDHMANLVKTTIPVLVDSLPSQLDQQVKWRDVYKALIGPFASSAISVIADNPQAFLGKELGKIPSALATTLLKQVAAQGLSDTFTETGMVALYRSSLGLAATRPDLFLGAPETNAQQFATKLFQDLAACLGKVGPFFGPETIAQLASTALDTLASQKTLLFNTADPWQAVISDELTPILTAIKTSIGVGSLTAFKQLATGDGLKEFVRILFVQIAKTPGMVVSENDALQQVVAGVVSAMAQDKNLLLTQDDWLKIAGVAAEEAAQNPGRLFGLKTGTTTTAVFTPLIEGLLSVAGQQWQAIGPGGKTVLFGDTLRDAIIIVLRKAAGNATAALSNAQQLRTFTGQLTKLVDANPGKFGRSEWLQLYSQLLPEVLETGQIGPIDVATLETNLKRKAA
jgi:hypothetical protein